MSGLEKIIAEIRDEAAAEAAKLLDDAKAEAGDIAARAKADSDARAARTAEGAGQDVKDIENARQSALALQRRQRTLQTKQELLSETLDKALDSLYALDDKEYFNLLLRLAEKSADKGKGVMYLNEKDKARLPGDFEKQLAAVLPAGKSLSVSEQTRPIDGGFVLGYEGVEENCSFRAIFDARREEFSDLIQGTLFGD